VPKEDQIYIFNPNGLNKSIKNWEWNSFLNETSYLAIIIAESKLKWEGELQQGNYKIWHSCLNNNNQENARGGIGIGINKNLIVKHQETYNKYPFKGRLIRTTILWKYKSYDKLHIIAIYAPAENYKSVKTSFWNAVIQLITELQKEPIIIGGDWNEIEKPEDCESLAKDRRHIRQELWEKLKQLHMTHIIDRKGGDIAKFASCIRYNSLARIDLCWTNIPEAFAEINLRTGFTNSDHKALIVQMVKGKELLQKKRVDEKYFPPKFVTKSQKALFQEKALKWLNSLDVTKTKDILEIKSIWDEKKLWQDGEYIYQKLMELEILAHESIKTKSLKKKRYKPKKNTKN